MIIVVKAIIGSALFIGGCIAGFAFLFFDEIGESFRILLANFSLICIILGFILGISSLIQEIKEKKNKFK